MRRRHFRRIGALAAAVLTAAVWCAPTWSAQAAAPCSKFVAKVYDQLNPRSGGQALSNRGDSAVVLRSAGNTEVRTPSMSAATAPGPGLVGVHRLFHAKKAVYYYAYTSTAVSSAKKNGFSDQGVAFYASTKPSPCLQPVYSYLKDGVYRFVASASDRRALEEQGWQRQTVRFYLGRAQSVISFAVYPDTQQELAESDTRFQGRSQWLLDTAPLLATRYALHTGDVTNWDTPDHQQYSKAQRSLSPLNGRLPYSLAAGNHDTAAVGVGGGAADPANTHRLLRETSSFNRYLRPGMRRTVEYQAGRAENSYALFSAGGVRWMVLTLELWPRPSVVKWARSAVASHPTYNVIVVTHSYLTAGGGIYNSAGYGDTSPRYLYDHLIKRYPNIKMTFSGHTGQAAYRRDVGVKGNVIHSYLLAMHSNTTNPTRVVEVNVSSGMVSSWVYAPHTKTSYPSYYRAPAAVSWVR